MTRAMILAALSVALFGFISNAEAGPIKFSASLSGPGESPPNASPGTGFAFVTIDPVAHTLEVNVTFADLLAGNTASHIHIINGPGDANTADTLGPVATTTPTFPGFPTGTTSGSYLQTFNTLLASTYRAGFLTDSGGTAALAEAALFAGIMDDRAYLNIHTTAFPGGENSWLSGGGAGALDSGPVRVRTARSGPHDAQARVSCALALGLPIPSI